MTADGGRHLVIKFFTLRDIMIESSSFDRRAFLRVGAVAAVLVSGGCGDDGSPEQVSTPPAGGGNRKRLKVMEDKAEQASTKKK